MKTKNIQCSRCGNPARLIGEEEFIDRQWGYRETAALIDCSKCGKYHIEIDEISFVEPPADHERRFPPGV